MPRRRIPYRSPIARDYEPTPLHELFEVDPPPLRAPPTAAAVLRFEGEDAVSKLLNNLTRRNEAAEIAGLVVWTGAGEPEEELGLAMHSGFVRDKHMLSDSEALVERLRGGERLRVTVRPGKLRRPARPGAVGANRALLCCLRREHARRRIEAVCGVVYGSDRSVRFFSEGPLREVDLDRLRAAIAHDIFQHYWGQGTNGDFLYFDKGDY